MRLIVISTEKIIRGEAEVLNLLFTKGMSVLHLRKPFSTAEELSSLLQAIETEFRDRIVLHDHFELYHSYGVKGIHLNRRNPEPLQGKTLSRSCSCHSVTECIEKSEKYDYLFLSPVFDSISKPGYGCRFSTEELVEANRNISFSEKVIALGGITSETIPLARQYGFKGVAVLGGLWGSYEFDLNEKKVCQRFDSLKKVCEQR